MATNKRKDAAALFELIDKSTLKIPKNAGQLKIPSWWSSRNNPPAPGADAAPEADASDVSEEIPAESTPAPEAAAPAAADPATPPAPAAAPLFDSPPAQTSYTPAIRPPAAKPPAPATPSAAPAETAPIRNTGVGVFAPATRDPRNIKARGRFPMWAIAVAVGVLGLGVLAYATMQGDRKPATPPGPAIANNGLTENRGPRTGVVPVDDGANRAIPTNTNTNANPNPNPLPQPQPQPPQGRIVPIAEVQRTPGMQYLIIVTAREDVANNNARYLADNGLEVTVGRQRSGLYSVMSVQGFARQDAAAEALRKRVVELGKQHPEARRARKGVYDTAYFATVTKN